MKKITISIFILLLILSACSGNDSTSDHEEDGHHHTPSGDLREKTASSNELPSFLNDHAEEMGNIYVAVSQHQELLEHIPCYCGCGDDAIGHRDNYDCFIHQNEADGSIVWDDHATRCNACLTIAVESIVEYQNGKSIKEIREMIEENYQEGYGEPTPTPEV